MHANGPAVRNNLGLVLIDAKRLDEASAYLEEAARLQPDDAEIQNNLGVCQARSGDRTAARIRFDKALALRPGWPEGHLNLANIQRQEDQLEDAVENYRKALEGNPDDYRTYGSLALAQVNLNVPDDAIESYERALELAPDDPELRKGLGIAQLLKGDLYKGWRNYEARLHCDDQRSFAVPSWGGDDLAGGSVLIHAEQGFGDTLQFCRYLTRVSETANAGAIVFECQRPLYRLLASIDGADTVVARGDPLPNTDFHVPLLSLPRLFDTTLDNIPAPSPYLSIPAETPTTLSDRNDGRARIGIVWKGNPNRQDDEKRSCPLAELRPLADIPGIQLFSLQTDTTEQERQWLAERDIVDLAAGFRDFADTAAHITALDFIVSVDTAAAHLAGALGKPIWVLLGESADWRYLIGRSDCPWYPTMRLFRQQIRGDWHGTAQRLGQALVETLNL
jgi:Flp pilus assembly protein TadD